MAQNFGNAPHPEHVDSLGQVYWCASCFPAYATICPRCGSAKGKYENLCATCLSRSFRASMQQVALEEHTRRFLADLRVVAGELGEDYRRQLQGVKHYTLDVRRHPVNRSHNHIPNLENKKLKKTTTIKKLKKLSAPKRLSW